MVRYLCGSGEPPVFFEIPYVNSNSGERQQSYEQTMRKEGHEPQMLHCDGPPSWDYERLGYEQIERTLATGGLPGRTILCANDRFAFGAMAAAYAAGLKIGRGPDCDVRIAGHDDHPLSRFTIPPLTTMAQNADGIASRSVEILLERMAGRDAGREDPATRVILGATLMKRDSARNRLAVRDRARALPQAAANALTLLVLKIRYLVGVTLRNAPCIVQNRSAGRP
jgi:DNA-binding LacI/PurR family transcriptional regulator